jgi:ubiquinone/menaquinone biosynthesis C-methylase UbiE
MKDIVENRRRITLLRKFRLARLALKENGITWCLLLLIYYAASSVANRAFGAMDGLRKRKNIPGLNSAALNKEIWEAWDWGAGGDEWTHSLEWKQSLIRCVLTAMIPEHSSILEIGPGAGRWTEALLERASSYLGIDISSACVAHCRERFAAEPRARFVVGSGRDLAASPDASVDALWSFDVFVHINRAEVEEYAREFRRVLRPGGIGIIHHGAVGGALGGWRSNLTGAEMASILEQQDLKITKVIDHWTDGTSHYQLEYGDLLTAFSLPAA